MKVLIKIRKFREEYFKGKYNDAFKGYEKFCDFLVDEFLPGKWGLSESPL